LMALCAKMPWKTAVLNYIDICSMIVINFIIVSSSSFVIKKGNDMQSFVVFHLFILTLFFGFGLYVVGAALYWAKVRGLSGAYGSDTHVGKISQAWLDFIKVSAMVDDELLANCIKTLTEFDMNNLVRAMGSFQSLDGMFGQRLAPRIRTMAHTSVDAEDLAGAVRRNINTCRSSVNLGKSAMLVVV
jgi:hypothetical protein